MWKILCGWKGKLITNLLRKPTLTSANQNALCSSCERFKISGHSDDQLSQIFKAGEIEIRHQRNPDVAFDFISHSGNVSGLYCSYLVCEYIDAIMKSSPLISSLPIVQTVSLYWRCLMQTIIARYFRTLFTKLLKHFFPLLAIKKLQSGGDC